MFLKYKLRTLLIGISCLCLILGFVHKRIKRNQMLIEVEQDIISNGGALSIINYEHRRDDKGIYYINRIDFKYKNTLEKIVFLTRYNEVTGAVFPDGPIKKETLSNRAAITCHN